MIKELTGNGFYSMVENGIRNVGKNRKMLNDLNVFPVPDGDTGTNMLMTLKYGIQNCKNKDDLSLCAKDFALSAVFGARGNSGVILSQFFKGLGEGLSESKADACLLCTALEKGAESAYRSVAKPVEGTMLTVIREGSEAVKKAMPLESVQEVLEVFLKQAKITLENTPEMLPVLKKAGVVDSGGSGIVCFFEGALKYMLGEKILEEAEEVSVESFDFSLINKDTPMDYGYCVEGLIQLKIDENSFSVEDFRKTLNVLGKSVVASCEKDKVKLHIHTQNLGKIMDYCQKFGEFLTIKIENMTVQNIFTKQEESQKIMVADEFGEKFNIVAVATNAYMQKKFIEMGADVVILSDITPSSQDFIDAFSYLEKDILVFPNSKNSILSAVQAGGLCQKRTKVINSRSVAECYSALSVLDFDSDVKEAVDSINETINGMHKVYVYHAQKESTFDGITIRKNDFFALSENEKIVCVDETIEKVALSAIKQTKKESCMVTVFYADDIADEFVQNLCEKIDALDLDIDVASVCSMENTYSLILIFE